jgi:hypothetical protein
MRMDCDATRSGAMQAAADALADDIRGQGGCDAKRDERSRRRTERHVQPREMPGNKADGAKIAVQLRRTRL